MKKFELTFAFLQLPLDFLLLILAGFSAYQLRFTDLVTSIRPVIFGLTWQQYWPMVVLVAMGWLVIFAFTGLYHSDSNRKLSNDLKRVLLACTTGFGLITIFVFFTIQQFDSRFLVLAAYLIAIIYVGAGRIMMKGIKIMLFRDGIGLRKTVVIGEDVVSQQIITYLKERLDLGYKVVKTFSCFNESVGQNIKRLKINEIIFTEPKAKPKEVLAAISFANENHITFKYSADLFATVSSNMAISTIAGIPVVELRRTRLAGWGNILKRLFDVTASFIIIAIFSPLYVAVALAVAIEDGFPIIYRNERVGQAGRLFFTLKFRSMYKKDCTGKQFGRQNTAAMRREKELIAKKSVKAGPVYKIKNDPRITKVGSFIRRWSLDEFPQFFNVLFGDMSLVGPRPHQPREVDKYNKEHKIVLAVKPGITGLPQISGRSDLSWEEEVKLDTYYIENWSLMMDLFILLKTPFAVILKKGAW